MSTSRRPISRSITKLAASLFTDSSQAERFLSSLHQGSCSSEALINLRPLPDDFPLSFLPRLSWQPEFTERLVSGSRAGALRWHEQGYYYCLDLSSVFCAAPLNSISALEGCSVLDMCASPGGKAIFAYRALRPSQLVCNEVIGKRLPALLSNLKRCRVTQALVSSSDSSRFSADAPSSFDLVIVDAPCSGQSLAFRGERAPGAFHAATINLNANRQRRILANACCCVKPGGYILYCTCTFSPKENEQVVEWLLRKFPNFEACKVDTLQDFQSRLCDLPCYRIFPHQGAGAGGFTCLLHRSVDEETGDFDPDRFRIIQRL
ncbi:MAG: Fmu (Sun) domain-containing protein [Proteobacteria bacterium]|nr:MAG: Fmu (Sun) domain-containing protein [Pseudomonadota bacterium]